MKYQYAITLTLALAPAATAQVVPVWNSATQPPIVIGSVTATNFTIPSHCAFAFDDPHIFTFDNRKFDCQVDGDFTYAKSRTTNFEIQGRFTGATPEAVVRAKAQGLPVTGGRVTKAIVIKTDTPGEPIIEIDADVAAVGSGENLCEMKYAVDGKYVTLGADAELGGGTVTFQRRHALERDMWKKDALVFYTTHYRNFFFKKSGIFVQTTKRASSTWGCYINVRICLPESIKKQGIMGILGNADGNPSNDLMTRLGQPIASLPGSAMPSYCIDNWCVPKGDSLFLKPNPGATCQGRYDAVLAEAIKKASPEIKAICNNDEDCLFDILVTGDVEAGRRTLADKALKDDPVEKVDKNHEDDVEKDTCKTVEGKELPCDSFEGNLSCEALGYDFGYKMAGCNSQAATFFNLLELTDSTPTCKVGNYNYGAFDLTCSSTGKDATVKSTAKSVIKVSGGGYSTIFTNLVAGQPYTLKTGMVEKEYKVIQDIEFCFKCPVSVVDKQLVTCAADVKRCASGKDAQRDPLIDCEFPASCLDPPCSAIFEQCGGINYAGPTCCLPGSTCVKDNSMSSTCQPESDPDVLLAPPKTTPMPTGKPTASPTGKPTASPTGKPTAMPTGKPTTIPTGKPTATPTGKPTPMPSPGPTPMPTTSPTGKPTPMPSPGPTTKPTSIPTAMPSPGPMSKSTEPPKKTKGSSSGDPHFKTWTGEKFDYHGECDLVLVHSPTFNNGQGLRVHIRTTRVKYFSFIEKVAIQIGNEVLEFGNDADNFLINGEKVGENKVHHKTMFAGFVVRRDSKAISIRLQGDSLDGRRNGNVSKIDLHTRKNGFPAVIVEAAHSDIFVGSLGLLGEWGTGRKLARDGETEIEVDPVDATEFALEWQVRDTEPMLFQESRFPQFPSSCIPPEKMAVNRLGAMAAKKEAEEACSHWKYDIEDCIFDVLATRDVLVAEEGHIVHIE